MIRIRNKKGKIIEFNDEDRPIIVEITDGNNDVGLVFIESGENKITEIAAGSLQAEGYAKTFGVKFCEDIKNINK